MVNKPRLLIDWCVTALAHAPITEFVSVSCDVGAHARLLVAVLVAARVAPIVALDEDCVAIVVAARACA